MPPRISRAAVEDVFADVAPMLRRIANGFARRYHLDADDYYGEACLHALEFLHDYRGVPGDFAAILPTVVWRNMLDDYRLLADRGTRHHRAELHDVHAVCDPEPFDTDLIESTVGDDAWDVVLMVLRECPMLDVRIRSTNPAGGSTTFRRCLTEHLTETRGWNRRKVVQTLSQIEKALL